MRIKVLNATVEIFQGDITGLPVDAIVNPANNHLWMGGGVAGAIKAKGGETIEEEAVAQGPVKLGSAVMTSAGSLKAKHVIHAAAMGQDLKASEDSIRAATRNSLKLAEERKLESVAFPAIAIGAGGFSPHRCAQIMLEETVAFLQESKFIRQILFVLWDEETFTIFKEHLSGIFSRGGK